MGGQWWHGSCLTICQTCLPCPPSGQIWLNVGGWWGRGKCLGQGLEYEKVKSGVQHMTVNGSVVVMTSNSHHWSSGLIPQGSQICSILLRWNWTVEMLGREITRLCAGDSCRTRGIESVGTVELKCVGGLLRMSGESLLLLVWRSVGSGFTGKGELDVWVVRAVTWQSGNLHGMGAAKSVCPVHLVDRYSWMLGRSVVEKNVLCSDWKEKYVEG